VAEAAFVCSGLACGAHSTVKAESGQRTGSLKKELAQAAGVIDRARAIAKDYYQLTGAPGGGQAIGPKSWPR
jgi:hypothetical protein